LHSDQSSMDTSKFINKIIHAQDFELELQQPKLVNTNSYGHKSDFKDDDIKIEEPSDSDDDDLDRQ